VSEDSSTARDRGIRRTRRNAAVDPHLAAGNEEARVGRAALGSGCRVQGPATDVPGLRSPHVWDLWADVGLINAAHADNARILVDAGTVVVVHAVGDAVVVTEIADLDNLRRNARDVIVVIEAVRDIAVGLAIYRDYLLNTFDAESIAEIGIAENTVLED